MLKLLPALFAVIACTPRMHRAYRSTVLAGGIAAQIVDTRQTQWAVSSNLMEEANPLLGKHPSNVLLGAGGVLGASLMLGLGVAVERISYRGPETEWVKDVIATLPLIIEGYSVYHNVSLIGADKWQNW